MTVSILPKCVRGEFPSQYEFPSSKRGDYWWAGNCHIAIAAREAQANDKIRRKITDILLASRERMGD